MEKMVLNGVLAPNVALRRSKGRRSVLFILKAAEAGSIFLLYSHHHAEFVLETRLF